jgi:hypothetical protein
MTHLLTLNGYTAVARFKVNMLVQDGELAKVIGYAKLPNGDVKPVYRTIAGQAVLMTHGLGTKKHVFEVPEEDVKPSEDACL